MKHGLSAERRHGGSEEVALPPRDGDGVLVGHRELRVALLFIALRGHSFQDEGGR